MSKFLERLEYIAKGAPARLGFGAPAQREKMPAMGCVGLVRDVKSLKRELVSKGALDAVVFAGDAARAPSEHAKELVGEAPWGVWVPKLEAGQPASLKERGCDFMVVEPDGVELSAMEDEGMAYFLAIPPDLEEKYLRSIEELPVEGVVLTDTKLEPPLMLRHLMQIGAVRVMFSKYLLVEVSPSISAKELERLHGVGVETVAVDLKGVSTEALGGLREKLLAVPRQRKPRSERVALLPRMASRGGPSAPPDEDGEEEEDE